MSHGGGIEYSAESCHHANSLGISRPLGRRNRSLFLTMCHWQWLLHWMVLCTALVWLPSSTTVAAVTLPVAMPPSHPKYFLTVAGQDSDSQTSTSSVHSLGSNMVPVEAQGKEVREDEVMHHFYKNGRLGSSSYRKASTVFMVRLFNDLIRGLAPVPSARRAFLSRRNSNRSVDEADQPVTDTIRSFSAREVKYSKKKKASVSFFVPFLPPNERLRSAELRFLRRSGARRKKKKTKRRRKRYKLRINVMRNGRVVEKVMLRERAVIQQDYDVFDVTRVLDSWINAQHGNVSLHVRIPRKLEKSILLSDASLKSTSLVALYLEDREFLKNMYESYTTDDLSGSHNDTRDRASSNGAESNRRSRAKRASSGSRGNRDSKRRKNKNKNKKRWYRAPKHEKCQMYDFKVDFEFIGWGQWIIHPKNFNARFCYGECPSPVDSKYKPTNHAMLQTLMRQKKRRLAPPTCCVPIKLKPLSMMYFEYEEIVVRHHENMIADECGCR